MAMGITVMEIDSLPECLRSLPRDQQMLVNDQLLNNEVSPDEEIVELFIDGGMTKEQAEIAVNFRTACFLDPLLHVYNPAD